MMGNALFRGALACFLLWGCCGQTPAAQQAKPTARRGVDLLWDKFGVPHVFAKDAEGLFFGFGYAQMQSHGDLLLRCYAESRGRAAEYLGESYANKDRYVRTVGVPQRGRLWYSQQTPEFRRYLDAFAAGINAYAQENPSKIAPELRRVLPVDGTDPVTHSHRVVHFEVAAAQGTQMRAAVSLPAGDVSGSNAWAVGPKKSTSGKAMLLANPHRAWGDLLLFYEAHLSAPGIEMYGTTHVGFPVLRYSFHDDAGWAQTVNTLDASDIYKLSLRLGGYVMDGVTRQFETTEETIKIRRPDGSFRTESFTVKRSVHGPIIGEQMLSAFALRVAGLDRPRMLEQYWRMGLARNLAEFETALRMMQHPLYTVIYADRDGHIMHLFHGLIPVRQRGDYDDWLGLIPGDTSATLWTKYHSYDELPKIVDPPSGYLQNTNDAPWTTTLPVVDHTAYPAYFAPRNYSLRTARSLRLLQENPKISFEQFVALKHNTRSELADRILDDLFRAAASSKSDVVKRAIAVLKAWDRNTEAASRGAVLFEALVQKLLVDAGAKGMFAIPANPKDPLGTPRGLADAQDAVDTLETVANAVQARYGALDIPYGEVFRFRRAGVDLPANGGTDRLGIFRTHEFQPARDGRFEAIYGETYVAAVEFSKPLRAMVLTEYGNSTQPGSPHQADQLPFAAKKQLRPCLRSRAEVEANLSARKSF